MTGCNTVSTFKGKTRSLLGKPGKLLKLLLKHFVYLANHFFEHVHVNRNQFRKIERQVNVIYDRTSHLRLVNETREEIFC